MAVILAVWGEPLQQVEFHFAIERPVVGRKESVCMSVHIAAGAGGAAAARRLYNIFWILFLKPGARIAFPLLAFWRPALSPFNFCGMQQPRYTW